MRIAIPLANGLLATHFGHCREFAIIDVNDDKKIEEIQRKPPPQHEPGVLPRWLQELGVDVVIAGGMGQRAQMLFQEAGVDVCVGAKSQSPEEIVAAYLDGSLQTGVNLCDH